MRPEEFKNGGRYRNRIDYYEVLEIKNEKLTVVYDNGKKASFDAETAARIYTNMEGEDKQKLPKSLPSTCNEDFAWTLGVLARYGDLQVDLPPRSLDGFRENYRKATGIDEVIGVRGVVLLPQDTDKWGVELRIYLPESVTYEKRFVLPPGVEVSAGFGAGTKRINKNSFWWHLVERLNFRLGKDQNIDLIEKALPIQLRHSFREGAKHKK